MKRNHSILLCCSLCLLFVFTSKSMNNADQHRITLARVLNRLFLQNQIAANTLSNSIQNNQLRLLFKEIAKVNCTAPDDPYAQQTAMKIREQYKTLPRDLQPNF